LLLVNVFATLPAQAGGCHPKSPDQSSAKGGDSVTVPVKGCEFGPTVVHVPEGASVTWVNHDVVPHTVTGALLSWGNTEEMAKGDETRFRFSESGTFPYFCIFHPGMAGAVVVGDGESDDILAAPVAMPPPSGAKARSTSAPSSQDPAGDTSVASLFAWSVLALAAGVGAGMAIKSRRAGSRLLPGGQGT
jgi:plastocyanin